MIELLLGKDFMVFWSGNLIFLLMVTLPIPFLSWAIRQYNFTTMLIAGWILPAAFVDIKDGQHNFHVCLWKNLDLHNAETWYDMLFVYCLEDPLKLIRQFMHSSILPGLGEVTLIIPFEMFPAPSRGLTTIWTYT